ncbi:MAG: TonB-dependent receptor, partial [Flavobacteriales bacterium]|nr:TonB-dependent receptor [Flavobacteriales bacterium]
FRLALGKNAVWKSAAVISENDQERTETGPFEIRGGYVFTERNALNEQKLSFVSYVRGSIVSRTSYQLGGSAMQRTMRKTILIDELIDGWLIRPYGEVGHDLSERLRAVVGLAYSYYTLNGSEVLEPRVALSWRTFKGRTLTLSAGQRGQLPRTQLFHTSQFIVFDNRSIGMTRSQELILAYDHPFKPHLTLHGEVYVQQLAQVPITSGSGWFETSGGSLVNGWDNYYFVQLSDRGKAMNKGVELSVDHAFNNRFFYQVNGTVLDATYTDLDDRTYESRWSTRAMGNLVVGREFVKQKEKLKRTWGVNGRLNVTGGQRYTPITDVTQELAEPYARQYPTFYRLDLRVYLKRERKAHTGMWSLDLLNATNAQNVSFQYYDQRKQEVVTKYQLGLIPNLSYRIEF